MRRNIFTRWLMLSLMTFACSRAIGGKLTSYYIDSRGGNDKNKGTDQRFPWKSFAPLQHINLLPGDSVLFKRGSNFTGPLYINQSGNGSHYITLTAYGSKKDPAPAFTNRVFAAGNYGNCIRVSGSYVMIEELYFFGTAAYKPVKYAGDGWVVWEMGAVHIAREATHCIIRNNEIKDCVAGIRSNGAYARIEHNYIHDCNRMLKEWNWGPLGIWLGADYQEVAYNRIFNYSAVDPRICWGPEGYGSGADGGAVEIDDARYDKSHISIYHNFTRDCQGFLEVTWTDVKQNPAYRNFDIHHNVCDDYQQFVALWRGEGCHMENNTIIRRKVNANEWGVFNITQQGSMNFVRNNIIVTEKGVTVFNTGRKGTARPQTIISHNLYYAASDSLRMGKEGPGEAAVFSNPLFKNYGGASKAEDFSVTVNSPAKGSGLVISHDSSKALRSQNGRPPDIGAFESVGKAVPAGSEFPITKYGKAISIIILVHASAAYWFAAAELSRYLQMMSGAAFAVQTNQKKRGPGIIIKMNGQLPEDKLFKTLQL